MLGRTIRTPRLLLEPVSWRDLDNLARLKADAGAFGMMLGGVRSRQQTEDELISDVALWGRRGVGMFTMNEIDAPEARRMVGITGVHERPDGRGLGLRIALWPWASGRGLAREGAGSALRFTHEQGEPVVIAVTREDNRASRLVLGSIGMRHIATFPRGGHQMLIYESREDVAAKP
ncbi:GNAT family N-acetyltransferase [Tanticharoenia sakaeratensis]|jgi:RimJ/RimL family protein N-acetyltransferase|uniref:GCN5-like N-acetyltransferase n=1 Tax=Tanticharoenia sakaeratensis NBRC 103193 TaxID=1231623 RepID=A0A0D6MPI5_9PROT|nr:GNAT family N-acetyltransferase [Tanticharoenia sakaeratensis]GAN55341.1 GCN5-like N-acetyltransferase [Tanticharoenia sakaeratensis NBRC 103193]GBQ24795.1 acetyltransferase [Tanticharoenia sakaeratensis NBRC 103193]